MFKSAPEWAQYLTQDYEGWTFHETKPWYDPYWGFYLSVGKQVATEGAASQEMYHCYERKDYVDQA